MDFKVTSRWKDPEVIREEYSTQLNLYAWALWSLESGADVNNTRALIIQISGGRVEEIEVSLRESELKTLKDQASRIVQGHLGETKPGKICRHCDFRANCESAWVDELGMSSAPKT